MDGVLAIIDEGIRYRFNTGRSSRLCFFARPICLGSVPLMTASRFHGVVAGEWCILGIIGGDYGRVDRQSATQMGSNGDRIADYSSTQPPRSKQEISTRKDEAGVASTQRASMEIDMTILHKLTALLLAAPLVLGIGPAQADDWSDYGEGYSDGYSDGYHSGYSTYYSDYEPRYRSSRGDVGGALALGVIGGVALGAIATSRSPTQVIVREDSGCYRAWKKTWNDYSGTYQRKRVLICN